MNPDDTYAAVALPGVVHAADLPGAARSLSRLVARGRLVRLFPQVYLLAGLEDDFLARCTALALWDPDAVLTGRAALRLLTGSTTPVDVIEFHSTRKKWAPAGFRLHRSRVPLEDTIDHHGLRLTTRARTALHLASTDAGSAIDDSFRETNLSYDGLQEVFSRARGRWGNAVRHVVVRESRGEPWSAGERLLHRILRSVGIDGWASNLEVRDACGRAYIDVAFPQVMLAIEVDGKQAHGPDAFEHDRERQNRLVAMGWRPLRLTWAMLQRPAAVVDLVREALLTAEFGARGSVSPA